MDKDTQINIRLSTLEKRILQGLAKQNDITVSELIRKWIMDKPYIHDTDKPIDYRMA